MKYYTRTVLLLLLLVPKLASAHCPLCVAGAGALAILAEYFGVSTVIVGVLIGAFALALGLWLAQLVKNEYVPFQWHLLVALIFLTTVIPIMPLVQKYGALYIALWGSYGSLLNNTYVVNLFLVGVTLGAAIVAIAPYLSRALTRLRGVQLPYQGTGLTLGLLIVTSLIIQIWPW